MSAMERFEIQQYELHFTTYEIDATSAAEAIKLLLEGDGEKEDGPEFVEVCDRVGMSLIDNPELADELRKFGVRLHGTIIPSIRSIHPVC
jgi:hypothetical protein